MRRLAWITLLALPAAGCLKPSAVSDTAAGIRDKVTPAASGIAAGSRRLVRAAGQAADDATLAAKVRAVLLSRRGLDGRHIEVGAQEGTITLSGHVSNPAQKQLAGETARATVGVTGVINRLAVKRAD